MLNQIKFTNRTVYYDDTEFELVDTSILKYIGTGKTVECPKNYTNVLYLKDRNVTGLHFHNFIDNLVVQNCSGVLDIRNTDFIDITVDSKVKVIFGNNTNVENIDLFDFQDIEIGDIDKIDSIRCDDYPQKVLDLCNVRSIGILEIKSDKLQVLDLSHLDQIYRLTLSTPNLRYIKCFKSFHASEVSINSHYIKQL